MTTIINTPSGESSGSSAFGVIAAILMFIVLVALFIVYGMPQLKKMDAPAPKSLEINVNTPQPNTNAPSAEVGQQ
jgi:hypothetical protein